MKSLVKILIVISVLWFSISTVEAYTYTVSGGGLTVGGNPPTTSNTTVNDELQLQFNDAIDRAYNELFKYSDLPDLAKGFANANAYAGQAGTLQGYQDYKLFAVTAGAMVGAQLPSHDKDYYENLDKKVEKDGDLYAGVGASLALLNVGINAGFIYPNLYLNAKFGYFSNSSLVDGLSTKTTLVGIGANYSWIKTTSFLAGLFKWRGISFGTGFIYSYNKTDLKIDMDPIQEDITPVGPITGNVVLNPSFLIGVESHTYSIPFDVTTSVRVLWALNFNLGLGVDLNFGSTDIKLESDGSVSANLSGAGAPTVTPGNYTVDATTKNKKPSWVRERITTGVGLNIWAVKIDVPVIIYPFDNAFAVGLTAGVVW
ncbi:MAG: hypothetical protein V1874_16415 [Spirochaetota bacterium]